MNYTVTNHHGETSNTVRVLYDKEIMNPHEVNFLFSRMVHDLPDFWENIISDLKKLDKGALKPFASLLLSKVSNHDE